MFTYSKLPPNVLKSGSYKYDAYGAWYVAVPLLGMTYNTAGVIISLAQPRF